jgi:zinc protease
MSDRFEMPIVDRSTPVRFPAIATRTLDTGLSVHVIAQPMVPVAAAALLVHSGTADDPPGQPGLASLTGDLLDEGAGTRDAIQIADAFGRLGAEFEIEVGPDASSLSAALLSRHLDDVLDLMADVAIRPRLEAADFTRVRELRTSRLRQLSRLAGAAADRAVASAVFAGHPYGHGSLGTTAALETMTPDDVRTFWQSAYAPRMAALIVAGAVEADRVFVAAERAFGRWEARPPAARAGAPRPSADRRVLIVDRPDAPQSEIRVSHFGPPRRIDAYHALVTVNALVGGQFTSRINRRLREEKGVTYGARSTFDFRRLAGLFSCDASVETGRTAEAVTDVLAELEDVRRPGAVDGDELARAQASLTRGYVRSFETAAQLVRAAALLVTHGLDTDTFDRFVPGIDAVTTADVHQTAQAFIRPDEATVVVVGDAGRVADDLAALGRPTAAVTPAF